jgi:hypothetical protein
MGSKAMWRDPRTVTLIVLDQAGNLLGALPSFELELPYWQEASDVVEAAYARWGIRLWVLRLLGAERAQPPGGNVTLLAQLAEPASASVPWRVELGAVPEALRRTALELKAPRIKLIDFDHLRRAIETRA